MPRWPSVPIPSTARLFPWIALPALVVYAVFLARHTSVTAGGSDSSGYLNSARILATGRLQTELRTPAEFGPQGTLPRQHFQPLGFVALSHKGHLAPTYPAGLPLHFAAAGKVFGWTVGPLLVEVGAALAAVGLCYAVARQLGLDVGLAACGAVMLGAFPVFVFVAIQPLSDGLATTWCLAAVWTALRARQQAGWAAACGVAFAMAVIVRVTNAVLLPALLVLLGLDWKRLALAALGGAPGAAWLAYYNHTLYGGALRSGYGAIHDAFAVRYGAPTLAHFGYWLAVMMPAALLVLPFVAGWRRRPREWWALLLWFGAIAGLYAFYEVSHEVWWCLRFILPGIPALILAGLLALESLTPRLRAATAAGLAAWAIACSFYWMPRQHVLLMKDLDQIYHDACVEARRLFPPDALVAASAPSGALYYYTDFPVLRWDSLSPEGFAHFAALAGRAGRPICAMLFDGVEDRAWQEHLTGEWSRIGAVKNVSFWRYVAPAPGAEGK